MMERPVRVQLSRKKGWRMPPNTVKVDRTTKWGNPFNFRAPEHCWTALAYGENGNPDGRHAASVYELHGWSFNKRDDALIRAEAAALRARYA